MKTGSNAASQRSRWPICAALAAATAAAFGLVGRNGFVDYDDGDYITANDAIRHGLNLDSLRWAFTTNTSANWHPVTWISHILDYSMFGLNAAEHHWMSVVFHATNAVLLFLCLARATGARWRSALAAGFFALHPLRVESVAWASERKDVLSGFFFFLTILAYLRYVEEKVEGPRRKTYYRLALGCFALGLLSKPMLVTLPLVLLLLDYWPLRRAEFTGAAWQRLVLEKAPFFLLAVASSIVTFVAQHRNGAVQSLMKYPLATRLENIPVSYARYLQKTFWPDGLAVFYPYPREWPAAVIAWACVIFLTLTGLAAWRARREPWLAVGWLWFVGMLVPAIGLVQVGDQSMADRYTYLPGIGIAIAVIWEVAEWTKDRAAARKFAAALGAMALAASAALTFVQVGYWRDSVTLFSHAAEVTGDNYLANYNLGFYFAKHGETERAMDYLRRATASKTIYPPAFNNLAFLQIRAGQWDEAITNLDEALRWKPAYPEAWFNLGRAWMAKGEPAKASREFERAIQFPGGRNVTTLEALAGAYAAQEKFDAALSVAKDELELAKESGYSQKIAQITQMIGKYREMQAGSEAKREKRE